MILTAVAATAFYTALNAFVLLWLTAATGKARGRFKVSIGDGGHPYLMRVMRGHANAIEAMPVFLRMLALAALLGAPSLAIHSLGIVFTVGRVLHAWHFIQEDAPGWQRMAGFGLSFLAFLLVALGLLAHSVLLMFG